MSENRMAPFYRFQVRAHDGTMVGLDRYRGKVLLVVNTASQCGFTPQYQELERLYRRYRPAGLEVLSFPCNQFRQQEPGSDSEIREFCEETYAISFPIFSKVDVNGPTAIPLYVYLKQQARGLLGTSSIKWNFTKFLVDRRGNVVRRVAPVTSPEAMTAEIEQLLGES